MSRQAEGIDSVLSRDVNCTVHDCRLISEQRTKAVPMGIGDRSDGRILGVVSTNALELGIDVGSLDACVMAGYPGSIASTWQRAGRAGRRTGSSCAVFVASSAPLDHS